MSETQIARDRLIGMKPEADRILQRIAGKTGQPEMSLLTVALHLLDIHVSAAAAGKQVTVGVPIRSAVSDDVDVVVQLPFKVPRSD